MNNIQSVGTLALKNQPIPEVETKQNIRKINFKADNDQFVRQGRPRGPVYTQPAILQQAQQPQQDSYIRMLEKQQKEEKKKNFWNKFALFAGIAASLAIVASIFLMRKGGSGLKEELGIQSLDDLKKQFFKDVSDAKSLKELHLPKTLNEATDNILAGIKNLDEAAAKGGEGLKTIFLYGPPGTGKTTYVKGVAKELQADYYEIAMSKLKKPHHGVTEANIDSAFSMVCREADALAAAKSDKRLVVFLDEIDSVMMEDLGNGAKLSNDIINQFKLSFNELLKRKNITVIGATNLKIDPAKMLPGEKSLDPAMLSRFKEKVLVDLPTADQIRHTIADHYKGCSMVDDVFKKADGKVEQISEILADQRHETSFRTLESIFDKAYLKSEKGKNVTIEDFIEAIVQKSDDLKLTEADIKALRKIL